MKELITLVRSIKQQHPKLSPAEILEIIKLVCAVSMAICPIFNTFSEEEFHAAMEQDS